MSSFREGFRDGLMKVLARDPERGPAGVWRNEGGGVTIHNLRVPSGVTIDVKPDRIELRFADGSRLAIEALDRPEQS